MIKTNVTLVDKIIHHLLTTIMYMDNKVTKELLELELNLVLNVQDLTNVINVLKVFI